MKGKKNFVIDSLGVKISGWGGQNIVRYFDPWVELVQLFVVSKQRIITIQEITDMI